MAQVTATPLTVRPHVLVAEVEFYDGGRMWSAPMSNIALDLWLYNGVLRDGFAGLSDYCCAATCWCEDFG